MAKKYETPKGTRDFLPSDMKTRRAVFDRLRKYFELYGFEELDTPAFEYLEVLTLKSGAQAENEIYSFLDKGDRKLGLRFDLTSSTGRVAAAHAELPRPFYRYQIGKVWRYDRPAAGRYREFYQADADVIGSYSSDCEVDLLLMATEVLQGFELGEYQLVINNRKILEAQVRVSGIPLEKKADALRALDKLLKIGKDGMKEEFGRYGMSDAQFDAFYNVIVVESLEEVAGRVAGDEQGQKGVAELREIFAKADRLGFADKLKFDWTLVRGLDYYTGPVFEAQAKTTSGFGSFAGGGRYDDLVGLYGGQPQGAVGLSFGLERLIGLIEERGGAKDALEPPLLVAPLEDAQFEAAERLALALRRAGISTRLLPATKREKVFKYSTAAGLPKIVLVGPEEVASGQFALRQAGGAEQKLDQAALIAALQSR
ncbi:MAG TPA: histidine--tRNA ligase [Polyangia bacterium]|jgi:histidyl-tRNA synthetase|nr:histidine--tRNA ligase [Polyangia bacterium]